MSYDTSTVGAELGVRSFCLLITVILPVNVPGLMPAIFGENGNTAVSRDSASSGCVASSSSLIGAHAPPASGWKQPSSFATVTPSSPPRRKPSPSIWIWSLTKMTPDASIVVTVS